MAVITEEGMEAVERFRRVYNTPDGRAVLKEELLEEGFLLSTIPFNESSGSFDAEAVARHNQSVRTLYKLGIIQDSNMGAIIDALMSIRYKVEEK